MIPVKIKDSDCKISSKKLPVALVRRKRGLTRQNLEQFASSVRKIEWEKKAAGRNLADRISNLLYHHLLRSTIKPNVNERGEKSRQNEPRQRPARLVKTVKEIMEHLRALRGFNSIIFLE